MAGNARKHDSPSASALDIRPKPLTVRSLTYKRGAHPPQSDVVSRVRGEFVEMRGFSPTAEQAAKLFHLPKDECDRVLGGLVHEGFLRRTPDGRYRLPT